MVSREIVVVVVVFEVSAIVVGLLLLVGHAAALGVRERVVARRLTTARDTLLTELTESTATPAVLSGLLAGLPRSAKLSLLGELTPHLTGANRARTMEIGRETGLLDRAARHCRSRRWKRRLRGARVFTLLGGGEHDVPPLFDDARPEVRAQAAAWGAEHPEPEVVARLLEMLGDPETLCRFTVKDSLIRIGLPVVGALAERLEQARGDHAVALLEVAAWLPDSRFLEPALRLAVDDDDAVRAQAVVLLAAVGGERAATMMEAHLDDVSAPVRAEAARGLGTAHHWPAAPRLAATMRDPSWDVRRAAAQGLDALGSPGALLLRRMRDDSDPYAADMAQLVLGLPTA